MRQFFSAIAILSATLGTGCASIVSGQDQVVSVHAPNCAGASCKMTNPAGTYFVQSPGTVSVNREYDDLVVTCEKEGFDPSTIRVSSSTKGMAFGNIVLGGVVGAGVDMATGAAYDYPAEIISPLDCRSESQIAAAPTSGRWDKEAAALVNTEACETPVFATRDGNSDIYKSACKDGSVGVIGCEDGHCQPLNISRREPESAPATTP